MSWHFSQALVGEFSARGYLDGESCARLRSIRTAEKSSCDVKKKGTSKPSQYGMTSEPSMAVNGVASWISSLRASRASPSASPEDNKAPMTSATYGPRLSASSKRSVPDTSCSKMCPGYVDTCPWSSETCEELATPRKGPSPLPPRPWVQDILGGGSGYVPTTKASVSGPDYARAKRPRSGGDDLVTALHRTYLPTPTVCGNNNRKGLSEKSGAGIGTTLRKSYLPSTRRSDADRGGRGDLIQALRGNKNKHFLPTTSAKEYGYNQGGGAGRVGPKRPSLRGHLGGSPNPDWLDWFVGLPIGWTGLPRLAMCKFRRWSRLHGIS